MDPGSEFRSMVKPGTLYSEQIFQEMSSSACVATHAAARKTSSEEAIGKGSRIKSFF